MTTQTQLIRSIFTTRPDLSTLLFCRGFLITTDPQIQAHDHPFYGQWNEKSIGSYRIFTHPQQNLFVKAEGDLSIFLIGHCLNPFDMMYNENEILDKLFPLLRKSKDQALEYVNQFTGSFLIGVIHGQDMYFLSDPSGMLFSCFGQFGSVFCISSHVQLIGDLYPVTQDEYTIKLINYRYFYKYGVFFPGDRTAYTEVKRVLQNHVMHYDGSSVTQSRFYPVLELRHVQTPDEYRTLLDNVTTILRNTLQLAAQKWPLPAISMTGGMDSKTTVACANGLYDQFTYYSYISMHGDRIDAEAAHKIAEHIGIPHSILNISEKNEDFPDIEIYKAIMEHNNGGFRLNANDIRKRVFLLKHKSDCVEVKSWISEIARSNYYKKFGLKKMPRHLSPRHMTTMFKIFTTQRRLAKQTDAIFEEFIKKTNFHSIPIGYDESDMYLWEFRYSAWGGKVITAEHSFTNTIFIPYNNRLLLNLMLAAPLHKRISDEFHEDLIRHANSRIDEMGITVTNWNETKKRMIVEKLYFLIHSFFRFL